MQDMSYKAGSKTAGVWTRKTGEKTAGDFPFLRVFMLTHAEWFGWAISSRNFLASTTPPQAWKLSEIRMALFL